MSGLHKARGIDAIAVRRTKMADAGKVRYRVYKTSDDFVAVIAESALMAIKIAGVTNPYRVVRDLPTAEIAVEAEKIAKAEAAERVAFATTPKAPMNSFKAELLQPKPEVQERFIPLQLRDLDKKPKVNGFILPQEALHQLIEAVRKPSPAPQAMPSHPEPAAVAPVVEAPAPATATPVAVTPTTQAPVAPNAEPAVADTAAEEQEFEPLSKTQDPTVLSPQEVEKLLND